MSQPPCFLALAALFLWTGALSAQQVASLAHRPPAFASWRSSADEDARFISLSDKATSSPRTRNALIGGAIGTVVGLAACTAISNLIDEGSEGFETCTWKGYLMFGGIGLGLGLGVGWAI